MQGGSGSRFTLTRGRLGLVLAGALALCAGPLVSVASAATFTVTNDANDGPGSLRAAIVKANATPAADTIKFSIPGGGGHLISVTTPLPEITAPVNIKGQSQPGYSGRPLIQIDNDTGDPVTGLRIQGGASVVTALSVTRFNEGIWISDGSGNRVSACWLGLGLKGAPAGNQAGVGITSSDNVVGGTRNVISGNSFAGVLISDGSAAHNTVVGNYIGTDRTGSSAIPNGSGVLVEFGAAQNSVGGTTIGARNVISGNTSNGVWIRDVVSGGTTGNMVMGNYIGTDASGATPLANGIGVRIEEGAIGNIVGGSTSGKRNLISGNNSGVYIVGAGTSNNSVRGNYIGTNPAGTAPLGNGVGIWIVGGASQNTIGGTTAGARNVISGNSATAVNLGSSGTNHNTVSGNYIGTNAAGTGALANGNGVLIQNPGNTQNTIGGSVAGAGNVISGNTNYGITIRAGDTNTVSGNYIGTDATGAAALPNANGIIVSLGAHDNVIGGTTAAARNVISGNTNNGILLPDPGSGSPPTDNTIEGNYIGTGATGTTKVGNNTGVRLEAGANGNLIGGPPASRNVISGNSVGIDMQGAGTTNNQVMGNRIGTNAAGTQPVPNMVGVYLHSGPAGNLIGGKNVISGNTLRGLHLAGSGTNNNVIAGNLIGTNAAGTGRLGNDVALVVQSGASGNTIGGTTPDARNVVSGNRGGVVLGNPGTTGNVVEGNYIGTDANGVNALRNEVGAEICCGATDNVIGGTTADARNVISGNGLVGVVIESGGTSDNAVEGNYIGTNTTGSSPIPNADGVTVEYGASGNTIGGTTTAARNVISGNTNAGIRFTSVIGVGTSGNVVQGNYVGTTESGTGALGNGVGVLMESKTTSTTIGGTAPGAGNLISGNTGAGVSLAGSEATSNTVSGNRIGTNAAGTAAIPNLTGVSVTSGAGSNTIGGTTAEARNVISGNNEEGVAVTQASGNLIQGNYIGTNASGDAAVPNTTGVDVSSGSGSNTVGGTSAGAGNLISGNNGSGVALRDANTTFNAVKGNLIGTNPAGSAALSNAIGVSIGSGASSNTVGGTTSTARNVISGNTSYGVLIAGGETLENRVFRNRIGTNSAGTAAVPNDGPGVLLAGGTIGNLIGGSTTTRAGSAANGNVIRFNAGAGVVVDATDGPSQLNSISGNSIDQNGGLGISLVNDANDAQPAPVITSVDTFIDTTVQGTLDTLAGSTDYTIELFTSPNCDPSGAGEGRTFVGSVEVTTDGSGHAEFSKDVNELAPNLAVTATATRSDGDTSEFSVCEFSQ